MPAKLLKPPLTCALGPSVGRPVAGVPAPEGQPRPRGQGTDGRDRIQGSGAGHPDDPGRTSALPPGPASPTDTRPI